MGNKIARTTQVSASEYYLHELPSTYNLVLKEVLGRGRFFKSIQCKHDEGLLLVKVYFKRGHSIDLSPYERRLSQIKHIFLSIHHPHLWPFQVPSLFHNSLTSYYFCLSVSLTTLYTLVFQFWQETDKAAYLLRQYFFHNLHDRLSTRPFLSFIEKKWLAFQLLLAVKQSHHEGVCHGDIKCENVLITSSNWLYLADFASFKPTYIPYDDPSDFSFFFDTGGRRLCYLAPERFYEHGGEMQMPQDAPLEPSMDIFAVGCVIAELFLEGQPLFELSQLLAYRRGQYDPSQHLEKIPDPGVRKMIQHMIQLEPELRLSAESYLEEYAAVVFPTYFSPFFHDFFCCWSPLQPDMRILLCQSAFQEIFKQMMNNNNHSSGPQHVKGDSPNSTFPENLQTLQSSGELLQAISNEFQGTDHPFLKRITLNDLSSLKSENDNQSDTCDMPFLPLSNNIMKCEGMVLITSLLCSCLRNVKFPHLRRAALLLLKASALYIDDEDRLQRVIPYVIVMLSDSAAIVRCAALKTLCDILPLVQDFPPSDAKIFPEYILPMLSMLPDDPEESVRICYSRNIAKLAVTGYGFLIRSIRLREAGVLDELNSPRKPLISSAQTPGKLKRINTDAQLAQLRKSIAEIVQELVMGPKQTPNIRRALLQDIGRLGWFFGRRQSNDFLLPVLPAFLNDQDEQLRTVFYEKLVYVCFLVGQTSVEKYLLPYIEQALSDKTEAVIVKALDCLTILCRSGFFQKRILLEMIEHSFPLLGYPSEWVKRSAVSFIAASSESLGTVDSYVFLAPVIRPFLHRQPVTLASEQVLLSCLKPPVSRQAFYEVLENSRSSDMLDRQRKIWYDSSSQSTLWEIDFLKKGIEGLNTLDNWADKQQGPGVQHAVGTGFQQLGLSDCDTGEANLRDTKSFLHSASTIVGHNDLRSSEKLQFSGLTSPYGSGINNFTYKRPSEGIPLYSFYADRQGMGIPPASDSPVQMNSPGRSSSSMPWVTSVSNSFNLASSVPAPKSASESFSINSGPKQFYRVVHEPDGRENETCVNSTFQDAGLSKASSILMEDATAQTDPSGFSCHSSIPGWRPRGVLVAHLQEHSSAVNEIAISNDHSFFVSASDDSTVKIWDSRKLEKDIAFRSKLTYHLGGSRALCAAMLWGSTQVIVGASDGLIHMFSIDHISRGLGNVVEKYSGIADITKKDIKEAAILSLLKSPVDNHTVMYSTQNGGIHMWDTRSDSNVWTLKAIPEEGYVSSVASGPCGNWIVSGSSRGVLTLWDLRFLIPVNSWQYSPACPIEKICLFLPPPNGPPPPTSRPLVYVAAGCNEVSLWNAENGTCHQVLKSANYDNDAELSDRPWALARHSSKLSSKSNHRRNINPKYNVDELNEPPPRLPGIRSLLPLPGGDLLTGSTDLKIRRWDHCSPKKSYCICGPTLKGVGNDDFYETKSSFGVQVVQETKKRPLTIKLTAKVVLAAAATDPAGCHRDSILSLASVKLNQRLLLSSARDGAIKVWK
ncbi:hypothetical protein AHAS_Ahas03G0177300 [Arachis hypogaea]|uniref:non-specific serine/threonine protein kinase n=1 Tax=Arachis hypogaea TaxID=3818 RepID=A0A445DXX1_ARAHY|nr:hypothetical protein Ahy_A03g014511 [Arachis hypogaea]